MVETRWSLRGTHGGELEGVTPTGKSLCVNGQLLSRISDGKFVEEWVHWDTLGLLRQIGAIPQPQLMTAVAAMDGHQSGCAAFCRANLIPESVVRYLRRRRVDRHLRLLRPRHHHAGDHPHSAI